MSPARLRTFILLGYLVLIAVVPTGVFVLSKSFNSSSSAAKPNSTYVQPVTKKEASASASKLKTTPKGESQTNEEESSASEDASVDTSNAVTGPTLNFRIKSEGRPAGDQSNKVFLGITQGQVSATTQYLLTFTVDVPKNGEYKGVVLSGLTPGTTYTAYIKGQAQIATSSAFLMRSTQTDLNNGLALNLITGDLNDDNQITQADYDICKAYMNATSSSSNWFALADFNLDGVINTIDLAVISRNIAKVGQSGTWVSTPATGSAGLSLPLNLGGEDIKPEEVRLDGERQDAGYWLWVPKI